MKKNSLSSKTRSILKWTFIIISTALVILFLFLAANAYMDRRVENAQIRKDAASSNEQLRPLYAELTRLEQEARLIEDSEESPVSDMGSVVILFSEPNELILSEIYPKMQSYGYVGLISVSDTDFPGNVGCLKASDIVALAGQGWELCLTANENTNIEELYNRTVSAGLPVPAAVYFPSGSCTPELEERVKKLGIHSVIVHSSSLATSADADPWRSAAWGSYESGAGTILDSAIKQSLCLTLTVGFVNSNEYYYSNNFDMMLQSINLSASGSRVSVSNISNAHTRAVLRDQLAKENLSSSDLKRAELEESIANIKQQIRDVYAN